MLIGCSVQTPAGTSSVLTPEAQRGLTSVPGSDSTRQVMIRTYDNTLTALAFDEARLQAQATDIESRAIHINGRSVYKDGNRFVYLDGLKPLVQDTLGSIHF